MKRITSNIFRQNIFHLSSMLKNKAELHETAEDLEAEISELDAF
jgi:hypothetical protein